MPPPSSQANPQKIFISYRRSESAAYAGRLSDQLRAHFGSQVTFIDIESIEPGRDFVEVTEEAITSCKILLAVIGRDWLTCTNERGRRLDDPKDRVRLEIATALKRGIRVIPVLVQGAAMPREEDLPDEMAALARRQAWEVTDIRWNQDVGKLIEKIAVDIPGSVPRPVPEPFLLPRAGSKKTPFKTLTAVALSFVIVSLYVSWPRPFTRWLEPPRPCPTLVSGIWQLYEAEDAALSDGVSRDSKYLGFSGDGFVSGYGVQPGPATTFLVDVPSDGQYQVDLCYANATDSAKTLTIFVNEERVKQTHLPNAPRWNIWLTQREALPLRAGRNAISYRESPSDTGQVNLDFIGIGREPITSALPQPAASPTATQTATAAPTPAPSGSPPAPGTGSMSSTETAPVERKSPERVEPTEEEMKEALLRAMERRGGQRMPDNSIALNNIIAGMTIKIVEFKKRGCKPADYGVGYECTYTITTSQSYHSNDGTNRGHQQAEAWNNLLRWLGGNAVNETLTRKFVWDSEGWIAFQD